MGTSKRSKDKKVKTSRVERTAYHEAGHAVMCYHLRQSFTHVSIVPEKEFLGMVRMTYTTDYWQNADWAIGTAKAEKRIRILLAGFVAESIMTGRKDWRGASADIDNAYDLAIRVNGLNSSTASKYIDYLLSSVRDMLFLSQNQRMIRELARVLLKEKTIGYRKAREIMRQAIQKEIQDEIQSLTNG